VPVQSKVVMSDVVPEAGAHLPFGFARLVTPVTF